jgi:signal transduction histidine kinase
MRAANIVLVGSLFIAGALVVTLALGMMFLGVPWADVPAFVVLLAGVGSGVGICALLIMRPRFWLRVSVRIQLVVTSLIGSLLLVALMVAGGQAMFISSHDLVVVLTLVIFGALLAIGFSLLSAGPLASRIERVRSGTARITAGDLDTVLIVDGTDEIAHLAHDFNHMAATLKQATLNAEAAEQARRELIAAVSHDLRTPLTAVRALIEAVADGVPDDKETETRYLRSARLEIAHLSKLVDDLFELAQLDSGMLHLTLEHASLHDLISDTLSSFQPQAQQQGVRLIGEVEQAIDPVLINPPKVQRVLHNLIANALRHTPSDGTILLRAAPQGSFVEVEVVDTGEGIQPYDLARIFDRSFRGEPSRTRRSEDDMPGAGLGLTIARGLIEAHGGTISVESAVGRGTHFRFTLQRALSQ